jgi:hypothetical protein
MGKREKDGLGGKGAVFMTDILIGIGIALLLYMMIPQRAETGFSDLTFQALNMQSNDIINVLSKLNSRSFAKTRTISSLISNGSLTDDDMNKTILDLIGSYWYGGNRSLASDITKDVLGNLTRKCYSVQTQNETIYSSCNMTTGTASVAFRISSGYDLGRPVSGYISRAWVTKVQKNTTQIIAFYPEGSAWQKNYTNVTKMFTLPENITIFNATLYVSAHFGDSLSNSKFADFKVNGIQKKDSITWLYYDTDNYPVMTARYGVMDVSTSIRAGNNIVNFSFGGPNYHSHVHPGMRLIVTYSLTQDASTSNQTFSTRYYFDNVIGGTGAWSMVSFHLPENLTNQSAALNLNIRNLKDTVYQTRYSNTNATDIKIFVNGATPYYEDGVTDNCKGYVNTYYCNRSIANNYSFRRNFNITNALITGTNVISVYADCYNDYHWGKGTVTIYSDPFLDPANSSFVEVNYTTTKPLFNYGEIDITKEKIFNGSASNPKTFTFTLTGNESRIIKSFTHIAQGFSSSISNEVWYGSNPHTVVFESPSSRVVPENVYIYPRLLGVGTNYNKLTDDNTGNNILPWSSVEYTYLVKGIVGYGGVFNTSQGAIDDAFVRLVQQIGTEGISAQSIAQDSQSIQGIQWLWGPSIFKLVLWEKT